MSSPGNQESQMGQDPAGLPHRLLASDAADEALVYLTSVLGRNPLTLTELNLRGKIPGDSGVKQLCALLEDSHCRIKTINLSGCGVTGVGYAALASALKSNPSHLEELDLRGNDPGHSEVKLLTGLLEDPAYKLQRLRLLTSDAADEALVYLTSVLVRNPLLLTELDLDGKKLGDSGVKQLCPLLEDPLCKFKKVKLLSCSITAEGCAALVSSLTSNPSHLIELRLDNNKLGDSGVQQISTLLRNPDCKLQTLVLHSCSVTAGGCAALVSSLTSNPSHLIRLDLDHNNLGDSGVQQISTLLRNPDCKLQTLRLDDCSITAEGCAALVSSLTSNPSHLIYLDLDGNNLGDSGVQQISTLLRNPDCKLQRLWLYSCSITAEGCVALVSALTSNPSSHLRRLDLYRNGLGDSGVEQIRALLSKPGCKLQIEY